MCGRINSNHPPLAPSGSCKGDFSVPAGVCSFSVGRPDDGATSFALTFVEDDFIWLLLLLLLLSPLVVLGVPVPVVVVVAAAEGGLTRLGFPGIGAPIGA